MSAVKIAYTSDVSGKLTPLSTSVIQYLCNQVGVSSVTITSLQRTAITQGSVMFDNLQKGKGASYKSGPALKIISYYNQYKVDNDIPNNAPISEPDATDVKNQMITMCKSTHPLQLISRHAADVTQLQVMDIAPSSIPFAKQTQFAMACAKALSSKYISYVMGPEAYNAIFGIKTKDAAFHIEIKQDGTAVPVPVDNIAVAPPKIQYDLKKNNVLYKPANWVQTLSKDFTDSASAIPLKL